MFRAEPGQFELWVCASSASGEPVIEENRTDLHQAFLEAKTGVGGGSLRVRAGRQEFGQGGFRLFDMREGANARVALDMVRVMYDSPTGWSGGAFAGYALREGKASWDDATNFDYRLYGATAAKTLGQGATAPKLELLYANTDRIGVAFDTGLAGPAVSTAGFAGKVPVAPFNAGRSVEPL